MTTLETLESHLQQAPHDQPEHAPYFLFMLGTDTKYTHRPTADLPDLLKRKHYVNGETLSYTAQLIAHYLDDEENQSEGEEARVAFRTDSVEVMNGPRTLGDDVGEIIAEGVMLVLQALIKGKRNIHLLGHSRGAVESILMAHELQRIKEELEQFPEKSIKQILLGTPCQYTKAAFEQLLSAANEGSTLRGPLVQGLNDAALHMFLIDPVPGGRYREIPGTGWTDERFYKKPPCTTAQLLVARDERTRCFEVASPSQFRPLLIPGHHGTASGNLYSQQYADNREHAETSDVQKLVVCKLIGFIDTNTGIFSRNDQRPVENLNLDHPVLDRVALNFIDHETANRAQTLLELYNTILQNDRSYKFFTNTSYPYLGTIETPSGSRYIHFGGHNYMALDMAVPRLNGQFVNTEHAHLYLHEAIGFDLDERTDVIESTERLKLCLNNLFVAYISGDNKAQALLNDDRDRRITFEAVSFFVDRLSQQFLRNHLETEEKIALLAIIESMFILFDSSRRDGSPINKIIDECTGLLKKAIKDTAQTQNQSLNTQFTMLMKNASYHLASSNQIQQACEAFTRALREQTTEALVAITNGFIEAIEGLDSLTVEQINACFHRELSSFFQSDDAAQHDAANLILQCSRKGEINLSGLMEAYMTHPQDIKPQLLALNENMQNLWKGYARLCRLAAVNELDFPPQSLEEKEAQVTAMIEAIDVLIRKEEQVLQTIEKTLIPLTQEYLDHLKKKAGKEKHQQLENILNELKNTQSMPIPSHRISRFYQSINTIQDNLKAHRDPQWVRYFKACMVAIALICTGIIPGLMALTAYAAYTKQSPLFFTQSHGERYINQLEAISPCLAG